MSLLTRFYRYVHNFFKNTPIIKHYVDNDDAQHIERYLDNQENRIYEKPGQEGVYSVTTILDKKEDEGKENALKYWRRNNNGQGDNADYEHLLHYKTNRGTLRPLRSVQQVRPRLRTRRQYVDRGRERKPNRNR